MPQNDVRGQARARRAAVELVGSLGGIDESERQRLQVLIRSCGSKITARQRKFGGWKWTNYSLGALGALLAAAAGFVSLSGVIPDAAGTTWWLRNLPGLLALLAAVVSGLATGLDPASRTIRIGIERAPWGVLCSDVLRFASQASRSWAAVGQDPTAEEQWHGWFSSHLSDLEQRFARQEGEDAAARRPPS